MIARARKGLFERLGLTAADVRMLVVALGLVGGGQLVTTQRIAEESHSVEVRSSDRARRLRARVDSLVVAMDAKDRRIARLERRVARLRPAPGRAVATRETAGGVDDPDAPPDELAPTPGFGSALGNVAGAPFRMLGRLFRTRGPGE